MQKIMPLLEEIGDEGRRRLIEEFWTGVSRYIGMFQSVAAAMDQGTTDREEGARIVCRETDTLLARGKELEKSLGDPVLTKRIKALFRECAIPLGAKSEIVMHAFAKPRGYAGDYGLLEIIYNDRPLSGGFGYCIDRRFQVDDYARAVRSRMRVMKEILTRFINSAGPEPYHVLNIACGSCREIREIIDEKLIARTDPVTFTLVDQDSEALDFTEKALAGSPPNFSFNHRAHSIYDFIRDPDRHNEMLRDKDLVYTIGLADYIPDDSLKKLVSFMYGLLRPGGRLVIAHKDSKNFSPLAADWWCDWTFHLRDEAETVALVKDSGIEGYRLNVIREKETNIIFFIIIDKMN